MKLIDRYIAMTILSGTLVALLVVVGLELFFSVLEQIDDVGRNGYTVSVMLQYIALSTPQQIYRLFPLAALLGSLMGMGALASNSELMAMRASGMSVWRIVRSVLQAGLMMLAVVVFVGEWLAPLADQYAQHVRVAAAGRGVSFLGSEGLWVRDGNRYINARRVLNEKSLADLTVYEFDDQSRLQAATRATHASYEGGHWYLYGVQQSAFAPDRVETRHNVQLDWPSLLTPDLLGVASLDPTDMSVTDIGQLVSYLDDNGLDSLQYRFAYWGRFMTPVATLVMLFISVPFVFSSLRSVGSGQRIFIGVMTGFGFYIFSQVSGQMGQVYNLPPLLSMLVPNLLFLLPAIHVMRRL